MRKFDSVKEYENWLSQFDPKEQANIRRVHREMAIRQEFDRQEFTSLEKFERWLTKFSFTERVSISQHFRARVVRAELNYREDRLRKLGMVRGG